MCHFHHHQVEFKNRRTKSRSSKRCVKTQLIRSPSELVSGKEELAKNQFQNLSYDFQNDPNANHQCCKSRSGGSTLNVNARRSHSLR